MNGTHGMCSARGGDLDSESRIGPDGNTHRATEMSAILRHAGQQAQLLHLWLADGKIRNATNMLQEEIDVLSRHLFGRHTYRTRTVRAVLIKENDHATIS